MKTFILIVAVLASVISFAAKKANIIDNKSKIDLVTVYHDRAFIKRSIGFKRRRGHYSVVFKGLTPILDKDSIKAKTSSNSTMNILGVRTKDRYLMVADNPKLEKLKVEKRELQSKIDILNEKIHHLIKEHKNLGDISNHYNESFMVNIHKKKWNKKSFESFLSFLGSRRNKLHGKWDKLYKEYRKIHERMVKVRADISIIESVSSVHKLDVFVDIKIKKEMEKGASIQINYLVKNSGWKPVYDLRIFGSEAIIEQYADIWQNSGEDWSNAKIQLSNLQAKLKTNPPSIGSYTLSYKEVEKVKTSIVSSKDKAQALGMGGGTPSSARFQKVEGLAKVFDIKRKQTIFSGVPKSKVFINKKKASYKENIEVVPSKLKFAYRKGSVKNPFNWTLATGPVSIFKKGEFVQKTLLKNIPKGDKFYINSGIDYGVEVNRHSRDKKESTGIVGQNTLYKRDFYISIKNRTNKKKIIKVLEQIPISEIDEVKVRSDGSTDGLEELKDFPSWFYWNVRVGANSTKKFTLHLEVEAPKDFGFRW